MKGEERYAESESPRAPSVAFETESAQHSNKKPRDIGTPMRDQSSETADATASIPKATYVRPQLSKIKCHQCNEHPEGYRGEHELRRHMERAHSRTRKAWICVDSSNDGKFLTGCRACESRKAYNAYYNAAAHLRRAHFNPKRKKGRPKSTRDDARSGHGGSDYPPMEVLKKFMTEVELDMMTDNVDTAEADTDDDLSAGQWLSAQGYTSNVNELFTFSSASLDSSSAYPPSKFNVGYLVLWLSNEAGYPLLDVLEKRHHPTTGWEYRVKPSLPANPPASGKPLWVPEEELKLHAVII